LAERVESGTSTTSGGGPKGGMMYLWQGIFMCCTWLHVSSLLSQTAFSRRSLLLSCYDTQATNFDTIAMRQKCDNDVIVPHNTLLPLTQNGAFPNKLHKFNICFLQYVTSTHTERSVPQQVAQI